MEEDDRISQLPEPILQNHILSLLPQKDAVRTCILSKSWRHLGPTRPNIKFVQIDFPEIFFGNNEKYLSVVEKTLQRYHDQNLPIENFVLFVSGCDSESISLLNKWVPVVLMNKGLKKFYLSTHKFSLPSVVFQAEFLTKLKLLGCKLEQKNCIVVKLHVLKCLSLHGVYIEEETFDKIMSSCPSIEHLVLDCCMGFSTIKVNKAPNLIHFVGFINNKEKDKSIVIDDAPSLETIRIDGRPYQTLYHHNNYFFPHLKSIKLHSVHLPTELLNNLSSDNCPCLEELKLSFCSGFTEFELSNCSIKRLIIKVLNRPIKASIDAANMLYFKFESNYLPTFSFSTTSRELKSQIEVWRSYPGTVLSSWPLKLHEFLKSLNQSQISLGISYLPFTDQDTYDGGSCERVVVEQLCFTENCQCSELPVLLNFLLFRICRPRYIGLSFYADSTERRKLAESIWTTLVEKGETKFWQQDLEESSIQVSDKNTNEWRSVQVCELSNREDIRFRLKWRYSV